MNKPHKLNVWQHYVKFIGTTGLVTRLLWMPPFVAKGGYPKLMSCEDIGPPTVLVVDDLMAQTDQSVADSVTKGCRYYNISVHKFYWTQNIFHRGRKQRGISLNANYTVCFKNPRAKLISATSRIRFHQAIHDFRCNVGTTRIFSHGFKTRYTRRILFWNKK